MNKVNIIALLILTLILWSCEKQEPLTIESVSPEVQFEEPQVDENGDCQAGLTCIPPIQIDTSCVQMQMDIDGVPYVPVANFACIIPHPTLEIEQLWINGSIVLAQKVVTLKVPTDIQPGTYPILSNTLYDAFYVPTIGADNFVATTGFLSIEVHDTTSNYILGGFEFFAENLQSPVQPNKNFTNGCFQANY